MFFPLVVGLGNPGRQYESTRHNLGWVVLDALARKHALEWQAAPQFEAETARWTTAHGTRWLLKPLTFMNNSGTAVQRFARFHRIPTTEIAVAYDDLTIDLGLIKVSVQGSAGGHNGVASLLEHVGDSFARFRLGIGPKQPPEITLADFVLGKFTPEQSALLSPLISSHIAGLELLLQRGIEPAMNQLNRRASQ
jgi:PTH1 family peptidyl-tRNA hydrolase